MLYSLEETESGVVEELEHLLKRHPELEKKMGKYSSLAGDDAENAEIGQELS